MIELDDWQKEVDEYDGDIILCTGRRVGKTYILAKKAIDLMVRKERTNIVMISLTEDQAMIIMIMALNYAKEVCPSSIGKGKDKPTLRSLMINKGKMIIRPVSNGDGVRGFEGGVLIIDEASRMPKNFWIGAKPILLTCNGKIWLGSTPFGKKGYFWERYKDAVIKKNKDARFKVFSISTEEAMEKRKISSSWSEEQREGAFRILAEEKKEMSEKEFQQEFGGKFVDDLNSYFSEEIIKKTCILKRKEFQKDNHGFLAMGCDIGRMGGDETTFELLYKQKENLIVQVESIAKKKRLTTETEEDILALNRIWDIDKIGIDAGAGALGVGIFDRLMSNQETKRKTIPMNNRAVSMDREGNKRQRIFKEDMYENLLSMMEKGEILLLDDDEIIDSFRSIQIELTDDSTITKVHIWGSKSHIVEGVMRAAWIAKKEKINKLWIRAI